MESVDFKSENKKTETEIRPEIYSKSVRAGKRTYFFDVKSTRNDEYYLTITESKKRFFENGGFKYEKHKLFVYPEDFEKFTSSLEDIIKFINENNPAPKTKSEEEEES